jgi:antitoxin component YwqK of YwqJK toxin-antitoxin module
MENAMENITRKYESFYDNGQIWFREFYRNGKRDGERKCWYQNGQLMEHTFYHNGKKEGTWTFWRMNGHPFGRVVWHDGKSKGEEKMWLKDGKLTLGIKKKFVILRARRRISIRSIYQTIECCLIPDLAKMIYK